MQLHHNLLYELSRLGDLRLMAAELPQQAAALAAGIRQLALKSPSPLEVAAASMQHGGQAEGCSLAKQRQGSQHHPPGTQEEELPNSPVTGSQQEGQEGSADDGDSVLLH